MIKFIVRKTIKDYEKTKDPVVRGRYLVLSGVMGIICNLILFAVKLTIGLIMGSIAIMSDAFNNLSDMGTSLVAIVGAKLSCKKPDKKHPFGHGRIEYICALLVSLLIMLVGFELLKSSIDKIIHPVEVTFSFVLVGILTASVLIKVFMFFYNKYIAGEIDSQMVRATATDSLTDCISTGAVIVATVVGHYVNFPVDGIIGAIVAALIMYSGFGIAKDVLTMLMGTVPDPELVKNIREEVLAGEEICGVHDLLVHDYGPGRVVASCHAEVSDKCNIVRAHEEIDKIESNINEKYGVMMVIHMDPISTDGGEAVRVRELMTEIVRNVSERLSIHDLRITEGDNRINVIFDLVIPLDESKETEKKWIAEIEEKLKEADERCVAVIKVDYGYEE